MRRKTGSSLDAVDLVVVLAGGQRALAHVHIEHLTGTCQFGDDRESAGVGKQVEHFHALWPGVGQHLLAHPFAAGGHVEEQAVVLSARDMDEVFGAVLGHHMWLGQLAAHDTCFDPATAFAGLESPDQRLVCRGNLLPALLKCLTNDGQLCLIHGGKAGQHDDGRERIQRDLFAARIQPAPTVKDALGIGAIGHLGNGG